MKKTKKTFQSIPHNIVICTYGRDKKITSNEIEAPTCDRPDSQTQVSKIAKSSQLPGITFKDFS